MGTISARSPTLTPQSLPPREMRASSLASLASVAGGMEMEVAGAAVDDCNGTICDLTSGTTGWAGDKDTSNFVLDNRPMGKF